MAEQDIYSGKLSQGSMPYDRAAAHFQGAAGAEQDRYGSHFSTGWDKARQAVHSSNIGPGTGTRGFEGGVPSGAEQDLYGSRFSPGQSATALGLIQAAVVPSFNLHAAFSTVAYGVARYTDRAEGKDWLWPTGMTLNAWWSAIGSRVINDGLSVSTAWSSLSYGEKLLLGGVTAWGSRLFYRIATRGIERGRDDPRYEPLKKDPGFWNKAFFTMFLPEAAMQTIISLPFTLPFRAVGDSIRASPVHGADDRSLFTSLAVFLFSAGFVTEVLADAKLASHKKDRKTGLCRDGVWSIVRHPNYLGDALIHFSFPLLLIGSGLFHPLTLLGPIANHVFLRFIGGDAENEATQEERYAKEDPVKKVQFDEYRAEKNSFWPSVKEASNKWSWIVLGAGAAGVVLERGVREMLK
ncbi:DUF1295 domain protein [Aspergillus stella-maris]|uniref:DUF1295 domain protein n=1 Tax=Aspergillus stella-maris TaxID=1810926 RepID=UPI003CCD69CB